MNPTPGSNLSASLEDYIEVIYNLMAEKNCARSKDIAARLSVSGASVTEALRSLAGKGLINYAPYEAITLTSRGRRTAKDVVRRHDALKRFFVDVLGIENDLAEKGACRVEHAAPQPIIDRMINFISYLESCPDEGKEVIRNFSSFCRDSKSKK
ncbi:MAG TPA: metal-dependent transcriptional regulator [Desulfobulbaceae bacterium]|nr:metal-dependent transcriptional regulator [Desulfobulbaceae bacterium]